MKIGILFGVGFSYDFGKAAFFFESRYMIGLKNINKGGIVNFDFEGLQVPLEIPPVKLQSRATQFLMGLMIPFGGGR